MKRGEKIVASVEKLTRQGDGIAFCEGREIVIYRTVPGDKVEAEIKRKRKGRFEATVVDFLEYGRERQPADCQHFGICGGCRWQDIAYEEQLKIKEQMVLDALAEKGLGVADVRSIIANQTPLFYRNKMEFSFGMDHQGHLQLGLHLRGRFNQLFNVVRCCLQSELSNRILQTVRQLASKAGLPPYNLKTHCGLLRFLVIREGKNSGEVMVNLVVSEYPCGSIDSLIEAVLEEIPQISTFIVTLHQGKAQVAMGQKEFVIKEPGRIIEKCVGLEFEVSPQSFFQTNTLQAERLYREVEFIAGDLEGKRLLDLYCGTGGIGLYLARRAKSVLGIELVEEAVEDARKNVARNEIKNADFVAGTVEEVISELNCEGEKFDLVILDPPRVGLHKKVRSALVDLNPPQILYVSCNPFSLADDLEVLCSSGYRIKLLQPIDMFPQTPHCEIIVSLVA